MLSPEEYIESGILELYVLGLLSAEEQAEVATMVNQHTKIRDEVERIEESLRKGGSLKTQISPSVKAFLMATIDYTERIKAGEPRAYPPMLNASSKMEDYNEWLLKHAVELPKDADDLFARIIGYTPDLITAVVWIKSEAEEEVHNAEHEKFLILEGTCNITINGKIHALKPGDFMEIPLHADHDVKVTSEIPCKVILQRAAA